MASQSEGAATAVTAAYAARQRLLAMALTRDLILLVRQIFAPGVPGLSWAATKVQLDSLIRERRRLAANLAARYYVDLRRESLQPQQRSVALRPGQARVLEPERSVQVPQVPDIRRQSTREVLESVTREGRRLRPEPTTTLADALDLDPLTEEEAWAELERIAPVHVGDLNEDRVESNLNATGISSFQKALRAGQTPSRAVDTMAVNLSGAATNLVLEGGREVIRDAAQADEEAIGWIRVPDADPCSWCAMLASRGAVFRSAGTAGRNKDARFVGEGEFKWHDHCVPAGTLVDGPTAEVGYRRDYQGEMVVLRTAAGHELAITPNHPILTDRGWVPAGLLSEGDYVLSGLNTQGSLLLIPDEEHVPALVEDVWGALSMLGLVGMPVAAEDFHGDGTHGKVDVVGPYSLLRDHQREVDVAGELLLAGGSMAESGLALAGAQDPLFEWDITSADSVMGLANAVQALRRTELAHSQSSSIAGAAPLDTLLAEHPLDRAASNTVLFGEGGLAGASEVGRHDFFIGQRRPVRSGWDSTLPQFTAQGAGGDAGLLFDLLAGLSAEVERDRIVEGGAVGGGMPRFDPPGSYSTVDGRNAHAELGRDLMERLTGRVERDRIVDLCRTEFSGHVFNFQTEEGWYRANGVIVSNCACSAVPVFDVDDPHLLRAETLYDQWQRETQGHSGKAAVNAWRRYWENRAQQGEET